MPTGNVGLEAFVSRTREAFRAGQGGARKEALSGSPLSTSGVAAKLERGAGGVRSAVRLALS